MNNNFQPLRTFSSIYGNDFIFMPRPSPHASRWIYKEEIALDMTTTSMLTVIGDMEIVCASSVSTDDALNLLHDAGFQLPPKYTVI